MQRAMSEEPKLVAANSAGLCVVSTSSESPARQIVNENQLDTQWLKFVRFYLNLGVKFRPGKNGPELTEPYVHLPIYSHLLHMFYIYFGLKLLASLALQHNYNGLTWELQQQALPTSAASGRGTNQSDQEHQMRMEAELELTVARLKLIGNAYYEFGFTVEIFYLYIVYFTFIGYAQPIIYNALHASATFNIVREFVMPERNRKLFTNTDIAQQTSKFIISSGHFMLVQRKETCRAYELILSGQASDKISGGAHRRFSTGSDHDHLLARRNVHLRQFELAHARSVREWAELAAPGNLTLLNRTPANVEQLARHHIMLILHFGMGPFLLCCVLFLILPRVPAVAHLLHNGPRDLLFQVELIIYCFLSEYAWSFYPALIVLCTIDHIKCVGELRRMIGDLIIATQNNTESDAGHRKLSGIVEHNLTPQVQRVLIHYKLIKEQILNNQTIIGFVSANTVMPVLVAPALARIYAAQLSIEMRHLYLGVCLIIIATIDTFLFPICYLHARCLELYRTMSNLLAHLDAVNHFRVLTDQPSTRSRTIYIDEHTLWLLRRELHQPEFATRQFATDAQFLRLTYSNLMGAHFYCGLWLVPMLMRNTSGLTSGTSALLGLL